MGEIYENIDLYLNGSLQGQELKEFEAKLSSDKAFAEEVRQRYILIQAIKEARKAELKQYISERVSPAALNKAPVLQVKRNYKLMYAAAASVVIALSAYFLLFHDPQKPYLSNKPGDLPADSLRRDSVPPAVDQDLLAQENASKKKVDVKIRKEQRDHTVDRDIDTLMARAEEGDIPVMDDQYGKVENQFEDAIVKRDEKIWDTILIARLIEVDTYAYGETAPKKAAEQGRRDNDTQKKSKSIPRSYDRNSNASADALVNVTYRVEYWRSPINFQGFLQEGKLIKLYGLDPNERVELLSYNDRLYVARGNDYYKLEADGKYHEYVKESDAAVLNALRKR